MAERPQKLLRTEKLEPRDAEAPLKLSAQEVGPGLPEAWQLVLRRDGRRLRSGALAFARFGTRSLAAEEKRPAVGPLCGARALKNLAGQ